MITIQNVTIEDIESLTEETAMQLAEESMDIKGHNVYFIDFGGYSGYSVCVFCNGHHIHYANDYELHHKGREREWLRDWYIESLNNKLFTEEELSEPIKDYSEYKNKSYFLQNYYGMREDYVSAFGIFRTKKDEEAHKRRVAGKVFNPVCYAYYDDKEFVKHCIELQTSLEKAKEDTLDNFDYWVSAIFYEMCNHEYGINWQRDYDTLSAFGNPNWRGEDYNNINKMFDDVEFNEMQRKAYFAAREKYYKMADEKGWM